MKLPLSNPPMAVLWWTKGATGVQSTFPRRNTTLTMEHNIPSHQQNLCIIDRQLAGCHFHKWRNWGVLRSYLRYQGNNWRTSLPNRFHYLSDFSRPGDRQDTASKLGFIPVPDWVASISRLPSYLLLMVVPRYNEVLVPNGATISVSWCGGCWSLFDPKSMFYSHQSVF